MYITENEIKDILNGIRDARIAVYGDFCLDVYWDMDPLGSEISVETGLQAEAVKKQRYSPGGAGNIVANLVALSPKAIKAIGVIGSDVFGGELKKQLLGLGADVEGIVAQAKGFDTYTYIKRMHGDTEAPRIDFGLGNSRSVETDALLLQHLRIALETSDVLVFNQQVVGSIANSRFIDEVNTLFASRPNKIVILDSRHYNAQFQHVYRKANDVETAVLNGIEASPSDSLPLAEIKTHGLEVFKKFERPLFVTCGSRGVITIDADGIQEIPAVQIGGKIDSVGAGDTFLSALSLSLATGTPHAKAAAFANLAAAVTIQKLHTTGTATGSEILHQFSNSYYDFRPELAIDLRKAKYHAQTEIELCDPTVIDRLGRIKHVVFDHDGTISTLREGWEKIMEPVMVQAILGDRHDNVDRSTFEHVRSEALAYIDRSTGIQTIVQMEALVEMVVGFGFVTPDQILDKHGYKAIYNDALMALVNERLGKLNDRSLDIADFTIKGAVPFLRSLANSGIKLYLASGTDEADVINEAKALGYADLFDGGIYGSVGDISKYSKKMVIQKILGDNRLKGEELLVIGDGPVEIREAVSVGGIALGIASDEIRRYGLNPDKRKRLIRSGAQMIIPDFSQYDALSRLLFSKP